MDYARTPTLELPHEEAVPTSKEASAEEGFGSLTEIDVRATLTEKLRAEMEPDVILGACSPVLAHWALEVEREIRRLLPCNVVVGADGRSVVQALDPRVIAEVPGRAELEPIATEAGRRIDAALATLQGSRA